MFEVLRSEARVMEGLRSLHIDTPFIHDILKLNVQPSDSDYAVDIRNPAISVRNNIIKILSNTNLQAYLSTDAGNKKKHTVSFLSWKTWRCWNSVMQLFSYGN